MEMFNPSNRKFVKAAMSAPYLSREEEQRLAMAWKHEQDQESLHRLTQAHMRLVIAMAARFKHFGLNMSDLIQEGHVGLLEAAARFEPEREVRFSTYATWWIRASIQDHILRNWSIVRAGTSSAQKALFFNLRRLRARIMAGKEDIEGRDIHAEIAAATGVSKKDAALMDWRLSAPDTSLNAPISDADDSGTADRQDFLVSPDPLPDDLAEEAIDEERTRLWLSAAMVVLNEREQMIVRQRRLSDDGVTLESLGIELGISKERVRQIESRALEKLRDALVESHGPAIAQMFQGQNASIPPS